MATSSTPIIGYQPGGGVPIPGDGDIPAALSAIQSGVMQLVNNQSYINVVFPTAQPNKNWQFLECQIINTVDLTPLNIWPGIVNYKTKTGFTLQLNGKPDSNNYFIYWTILGATVPAAPLATTYSLSGPSTGGLGVASTFFVALPAGTTVDALVTVTPSDGGAGGTFTPATVVLTTGGLSVAFTYTPSSYGAKTISVTNDGGLMNPVSITFTSVAATYTLSGPSNGVISVASTPFTVALPGGSSVVGTVTVTPSDGGGGTFTPSSVGLTTAAPSATFTYTPISTGTKTISVSNGSGLTNPGALTYAVSGPLSDGDPVSIWHDSSANHNDATRSGSARPIYKTNIINGKPVVRFTSAGLSGLNLTTPIPGSDPWTVFAVMKEASSSVQLLGLADVSSRLVAPWIYSNGTINAIDRSDAYTMPNPAIVTFHLTILKGQSASMDAWIDGTNTAPTFWFVLVNSGNFSAIGYETTVPTYSDGDIAELLIYNTVLSSPDQLNVQKYLGNKYGITITTGGTAVDPSTVAGLQGWWKADAI